MSEETKEPTAGQPAPEAAPAEPKPEAAPAADAPKPAEGEGKEPKKDEPVKSLLADDGEGEGNEGGEKTPQEAPESYEDFKLPEGFQKDGPLLEEFIPLAKEARLPQEHAQKFVDLGAKLVQKAHDDQAKAWEAVVTEWTGKIKSDSEIGGAKLGESKGYAVRALKQYADPETRKYLDDSRLANHPGLFKMLVRVGKTLGEDKLFEGGAAKQETNPAKILYPDLK